MTVTIRKIIANIKYITNTEVLYLISFQKLKYLPEWKRIETIENASEILSIHNIDLDIITFISFICKDINMIKRMKVTNTVNNDLTRIPKDRLIG